MKRKLNAGFALRVTLLQLDNMAGALPAEHARLSLRVSRTASLVAHAHTHDLVSRHIIDVHGYTPAQNEANDDYGF